MAGALETVYLGLLVLLYFGTTRRLHFAVRHWRAYLVVLLICVGVAVYVDGSPANTLGAAVAAAVVFGLFVLRHRRLEARRGSPLALRRSWEAYMRDCIAQGKTPLGQEAWERKGRAWVTYMHQAARNGREPLDFDAWQRAGEPPDAA